MIIYDTAALNMRKKAQLLHNIAASQRLVTVQSDVSTGSGTVHWI